MLDSTRSKSPLWRVLRNAASILAGDAGGQVLTIYAIGLAAVSLGPSGFGQLAEAQAFMEPFEIASSFGLAPIAIAFASQRGENGTLRGTIAATRAVFALIAVAAAFAICVTTDRAVLLPLVAILAINFLFIPFSTSAQLPFQVRQTMHLVILVPFLASIVRFGGSYVARYWQNTPVSYQWATCAASFSLMILYVGFAHRYYPTRLRVDFRLARRLIHLAWPAAALETVVGVYSRGSYFLLHRAGPQVLGEYAAADKLVRPTFSIAWALLVSALPTIAAVAAEHDYPRLARMYVSALKRSLAVLVPIVALACLAVPFLLGRFAPGYQGAATPFRVLATAATFMLINQLSSVFVLALGRLTLILAISLVNFAVYFGLALVLIPRYAATGAALATAVMEATSTLMQWALLYWLLVATAEPKPTDSR